MSRPLNRLLIGDLVRSKIVDASGRKIGRVVDLEIDRDRGWSVAALTFGTGGWLYRWGALQTVLRVFGVRMSLRTVRWKDVQRFEGQTIYLREDAEPQRVRFSDIHGTNDT